MRAILKPRSLAAAVALTALLAPPPAFGTTSIIGPALAFYFGTSGAVLKLDVAYDPANRVYLSTWCTMATICLGQFLDVNGQAIGTNFPIASPAGFIRVAWGNDGFVIAYTPTGSLARYIRFLRYAGGAPQYLTDPIPIANMGTEIGTDMASMVYVPSAGHYLITWFEARGGLPQSYLAAYRSNGSQAIARTHITDGSDGQHSPDISCDFASDRCLVAGRSWGIPFGGTGGAWARFVSASTGQPIGQGGVTWIAGGALIEDAQVAYGAGGGTYVVAWSQNRSTILGRRLIQSMAVASDPYLLVGPDDRTFPDDQYGQVSLRYNSGTDTFLMAWKNNEGRPWMKALSNVGFATTTRLPASSITSSRGDVWPTLAANPEFKQFGLVHSQGFAFGQAVVIQAEGSPTSTPPPPTPPTPPPPAPTTLSATERARTDFNGDGSADVLWQHHGNGNLAVWRMSGENQIGGQALSPGNVPDTGWKIVGSLDFNKDGRPDILWRHDTGYVGIWYMRGETLLSAELITPNPISDLDWRIVATGDLNADGSADILWQHRDGRVGVWYFDGPRYLLADVLVDLDDEHWRVVGAGDMNRDGRLDLIWRHDVSGATGIWFMRGPVRLSADAVSETPPSLAWRVASVVDLNRDGTPDLLWQNSATGEVAAWMMDGATVRSSVFLNPSQVPDTNWKIAGPR